MARTSLSEGLTPDRDRGAVGHGVPELPGMTQPLARESALPSANVHLGNRRLPAAQLWARVFGAIHQAPWTGM